MIKVTQFSGPNTTATAITEGRMKVDAKDVVKRLKKRWKNSFKKNRSIKNGKGGKKAC